MKKIVLLLFLTATISSFKTTEKVASFNIVGEWTGQDKKNANGSFIFDEEGYATMIRGEETMGGKEFELEGIKASMRYVMDESTNPIKFDLVITSLDNSKSKSMKMLLIVVDNNTIKLASNFNQFRPTAFTKQNTVVLKRK